MDAILDIEMGTLLENIILPAKIKTALLGEDNKFNTIVNIINSFEKGDWNNPIYKAISGKKIEKKLPEFYFESIKMINSFFS